MGAVKRLSKEGRKKKRNYAVGCKSYHRKRIFKDDNGGYYCRNYDVERRSVSLLW